MTRMMEKRLSVPEMTRLCREISREYDLPLLEEQSLAALADCPENGPLIVWSKNGAVWADPAYVAYMGRDGMVRYAGMTVYHVAELAEEERERRKEGLKPFLSPREQKAWAFIGKLCVLSGGSWTSKDIKIEYL